MFTSNHEDAGTVDAQVLPPDDAGPRDAGGCASDCSELDDACNAGVCDEATGACVATPVTNGASCDDGDPCTTGDVCTDGACAGAAIDCSGLYDACNVGACDAATGDCTLVPVPDDTPCDDGLPCTATSSCQAGACVGSGVACHVGQAGVHAHLPAIGGSGGNEFQQACSDGQIITGLRGRLTDSEDLPLRPTAISLICSSVLVQDDGVVRTVEQAELLRIGDDPSGGQLDFEMICPAGEVVVGIEIRADEDQIFELALRCAPLTISPVDHTLQIGPPAALPAHGSDTAGMPVAPHDCPAGSVLVGLHGRAGWWIDRLGVTCAPLETVPAAVRILSECSPLSETVDAHSGSACHRLSNVGGMSASYALLAPNVASVTLYWTNHCGGTGVTITADGPFCPLMYDSPVQEVDDNVHSYTITYE